MAGTAHVVWNLASSLVPIRCALGINLRGSACAARGLGEDRDLAVVLDGLEVSRPGLFLQARIDIHEVEPRLESAINRVAGADLDLSLPEIVLENDEACVQHGRVSEDILELLEGLGTGGGASWDTPIVGVELGEGLRVTRPDDGTETHGERDGTDTVVNVTPGRTEGEGSYANSVLDDLPGPAELGDEDRKSVV